jgi:hypothetical protein
LKSCAVFQPLADPYTLGTVGGILLAPRKLLFDYGRRRMAVIDEAGH